MKQRFHVFWIAGTFFLYFLATLNRVQAQSIQIDGTTPTTPGICTGSCTIEGGLQHGSNLFHSFSQFNVDSGATVLFLDPGVTNILSRVTGTNRSDILGKLGVSGGNANLFLINPNGIIFGSNASLNVGGSFVATTANAISFGNQGSFNASADNVSPLLTVNPSALLFNQSANGGIQNNSIAPARLAPSDPDVFGLRVPDGRSLLLVGGNVTLNGGQLNALGGRVELGGLAESGEIGLDANGNNLSLSFPNAIKRTDVSLINKARVDVAAGSGGSITINAHNINISETNLLAGIRTELGSIDSQAGDITLNATEAVTVIGSGQPNTSRVNNRVLPEATGNGGNIIITAKKLSLSNGSDLSANTFGQGNAGSIVVQVSDVVSLASAGFFSLVNRTDNAKATGNGGNITITARELSLRDKSQVSASTVAQGNAGSIFVQASDIVSLESGSQILSNVDVYKNRNVGVGNGGNITITARELSLRDGSELGASTFGKGNAGSIFVQASDFVSLESDSKIVSNVQEGALGNGSEINIRARSLSLTGGAQLTASVLREKNGLPGGRGKGGNIIVNASDSVNLSGSSEITGFSSGFFTATEGGAEGQAGSITVNTDALSIADGAIVNAQTLNQSNAGSITINATTFDAVNGGQIITTASSSGNAGKITVNATDRITLSGSDPTFARRSQEFDGIVQNEEPGSSGVFASTRRTSSGQGGDIDISTGQLLIQDGAEVNVSSAGEGNAGDIKVTADSIELNNRGKLTATSESGEGGDIRLQDLDLLLLDDNSKISTTAGSATRGTGNGGNITIDTDLLIGSDNSDITANAFEGKGGFIKIDAQGIFGLEVNETDKIGELKNNGSSDISASSQKDPSLNGRVEINRLEAEPSSGLVTLPAELVDVSRLIAQGCAAGGGNVARGSQFVATGRGGLPPTPTEALRSDTVLADLGTPVQSEARASAASPNLTDSQPTPFVEAQGWVIGSQGEVVLTAQAPTIARIPWLTPTSCNAS